jgi:hypothetical protein
MLVVENGTTAKRYPLLLSYSGSGRGTQLALGQLEPDGKLYQVKPGAKFPVRPLPRQPAGLPIEPQ